MLATTKQVRKLAQALCNVSGHSYTDKSASKRKKETNLRNITFFVRYSIAQQEAERLRVAMFLMGYTNTVKVTVKNYCYLRINNCILEK